MKNFISPKTSKSYWISLPIGWFTQKNGNYQFTETGLFFARAAAYGVTVSICQLS
jgi:hypothetical protein